MDRRAASYREFWPLYLAEHSRPATRGLHYFGTSLGLAVLAVAVFLGDWRLLIAALFCGYGFAWLGHAFIERNRPATFRHPFWSFVSDFRMFALWIAGRLGRELARHGVTGPSPEAPPST